MSPPNDSSTGAYVVPTSAPVLDDDALTDFLQPVIVGCTGLAGLDVRPKWQEEPPNEPDRKVTWAMLGITERYGNAFPYVGHSSAGQGSDTVQNQEHFTLLATFYGPQAWSYAALLRDGLAINQNREALYLAGIYLVAIPTEIRAMHELVKTRWLYRVDMPIRFTREVDRTYAILNVLSAAGTVVGDTAGNISVPHSGNLSKPYFP